MSSNLGWPEFRTLATSTASELGRRRGETWTPGTWHEDPDYPAATLDGPGSARLFIQYGHDCAGKITVTARLPEGTHARNAKFTANVDPARGARAIAQAADSRVLKAGYLDVLPAKVAEKQENDAVLAARNAAAASAAALFEVPAPDDGKLSLDRFLPRRSLADFGGYWSRGDHADLNLNGVPLATALRMLAVLAEDTRASCCYSYGPGHHPDLSAAGCLREDAERGHDASRQRAIRLLAGHGVDGERAGRLLDAAYRSSRGSRLPGTGITAAYDIGHSEFTVGLPRQEQAGSPPARDEAARSDSRAQPPCSSPSRTRAPEGRAAAPDRHDGGEASRPEPVSSRMQEILAAAGASPDTARVLAAADSDQLVINSMLPHGDFHCIGIGIPEVTPTCLLRVSRQTGDLGPAVIIDRPGQATRKTADADEIISTLRQWRADAEGRAAARAAQALTAPGQPGPGPGQPAAPGPAAGPGSPGAPLPGRSPQHAAAPPAGRQARPGGRR